MALVRCICRSWTTAALGNEHHVVPRSAGGLRGETILLCASCHNLIHRLAEAYLHNRAQAMLDQVRMIHPDAAVSARLEQLAVLVAEEMREAREGQRELDPAEGVAVSFRIPRGLHALACLEVAGLRDPSTGRRLGVPGLAKQLFLQHLRAKGVLDG